jgi:hypothetical protein
LLLAASYLGFFEASYLVIILRREDWDHLGASPDVFLTMTCNLNWDEIKNEL